MRDKDASSQAAWALITEGVTSARVEAHRLHHIVNRAQALVDGSDWTEHLYQVAGDLILAFPMRLQQLELDLDRTSLALVKMGESFLESRLPLHDKTQVEEAVQSAFGSRQMRISSDRVSSRWVTAQLEEQGRVARSRS